MMKSFFLLLLSVMTGCDSKYEVKACRDGWVEFICVYRERQTTYQQINVVHDEQIITSTEKDKWEEKGRVFLYHNTTGKYLKVLIKQLKREDFKEEYKCKFNLGSKPFKEVDLKYKDDNCQTPLPVTVTRTDKVNFTCDVSQYQNRVKFFCKENGFICEDILPTKSPPKSNGRFTVTDTNRDFTLSISDVSSEDAGVYWCGVKSDQGKYRSAFIQIQLQVELTPPTTSTLSTTTSVPSDQTTTGPDAPPTTSTPLIMIFVPSDQTTTGPDGPSQTATTAAVVCAAVLAVVIMLVLFCICSKIRRNKGEKQKTKEQKDHSYAEIQEPPHKADSGAAMNTVYVTASFPTNPSAFMDYSKITFNNLSDEVNGDVYSTVRDNDQHSTYTTVDDSKPSL